MKELSGGKEYDQLPPDCVVDVGCVDIQNEWLTKSNAILSPEIGLGGVFVHNATDLLLEIVHTIDITREDDG